MAADIKVIWVRSELEYFCERGWTRDALDSLSGKSAEICVAKNRRKQTLPKRRMGAIIPA